MRQTIKFKRAKTKWRKDRKLKQRLQNKLDNHRRKAGGRFTVSQWKAKLREFENKCAYCGEFNDNLEVEHMTPLSKGGIHDDSNIVPACRKCNAQKGEMTIEEWLHKLDKGASDEHGVFPQQESV